MKYNESQRLTMSHYCLTTSHYRITMIYTILCELVAFKPDEYTLLVFKDLQTEDFLMCCYLPNWEIQQPKLHEPGFLEYETVIAGESTWHDNSTIERKYYKYSNNYFKKFVPLQNQSNEEITIKLK